MLQCLSFYKLFLSTVSYLSFVAYDLGNFEAYTPNVRSNFFEYESVCFSLGFACPQKRGTTLLKFKWLHFMVSEDA